MKNTIYFSIGILAIFSMYPKEKALQKQKSKEQYVVGVCFSKDRPMQLWALLESFYKNVSGNYGLKIIYFTSDNEFEKAYKIVKREFKNAQFIKQTSKDQFKQLTIESIYKNNNARYVLFIVDDMIVKDTFSLSYCADMLDKTKAQSFHLRFGKNINYNYMRNVSHALPSMVHIEKDVYSWKFLSKTGGFQYPYSLDMALYRKKDIKNSITTMKYTSPNTLEGLWSRQGPLGGIGLCFAESKALNIPLNLVQTDWTNRNMNLFSTQELLKKFNANLKIDIKNPWNKLKNKSPHVGHLKPRFIQREIKPATKKI